MCYDSDDDDEHGMGGSLYQWCFFVILIYAMICRATCSNPVLDFSEGGMFILLAKSILDENIVK